MQCLVGTPHDAVSSSDIPRSNEKPALQTYHLGDSQTKPYAGVTLS